MFLLKLVRLTMILEVCTALNLTRLIGIYMSSCGEQYLCKEWPGMINYEPHPQLERCPSCSCEESCYRNRNCCPDKFYERKLAELRTPTVFKADKDVNAIFPLYELITTCPISAKDDDKLLCKSPPLRAKYKGPVTSLATNYSYMNEYCAICHGEDIESTTIWSLSTGSKDEIHILNFVDSMEMLEMIVENLQTTVMYEPPKNLQSIVPSFHHLYALPTPTCPEDEDLQAACSSSYIHIFRFYRNIFCYICSLSNTTSIDMNKTLCDSKNLTIYHACTKNPISSLTMPFRNIYCIICSHPPVLQFPYRQTGNVPNTESTNYVFEDFSATVVDQKIRTYNKYTVFTLKFIEITFNMYSILKTIKNTNVKNMSERIDEDWLDEKSKLHLANVMKIASGIYPWRICDMDTLPEVVQNISRTNCSCSFSCLFQGKCTCCIDTAIKHNLQCSSCFKASLDHIPYTAKNYKYLTVSTCFQNKKQNLSTPFIDEIKYLCEEQSDAFDLPVVKEGVTYKNVFCFICNRNIDIENDDLSEEEYKITEFNILCNNQFHFLYKINLHEILRGAREQNCGIVLNTHETVLCDEYPTNIISTCKNRTTQKSLQWACEKLNKHSLPPVHQYKNEFCELCNQMDQFQLNETYDEVEQYIECNKSNQMHVQYEKACRSLPSVPYHPNIFPYRNIFCSYCAHDDHHKEQVSSNFCEPTFGKKLYFVNQLIRKLFFPQTGVESEISSRPKEDTEYGCFPGRMYDGNDCRLVVAFQRNIRYSLHILSVLNIVSASNDSNTVLSEIKDSVLAYLRNDSISMGCELDVLYFIPKLPFTIAYSHGLYHFNLYVVLHMNIRYREVFDRDRSERLLLSYPQSLSISETNILDKHYKNFELKGLSFANISETMLSTDMYLLPNEHLSFIQKYKHFADFDISFSDILVQELLICRHRKIPQKDIQLDVQNYRLVVLETREIFYVGEYVLDHNDMVGVCAPFSSVVGSESIMTELLQTLTTVLNIASTTGLVILLVIYFLIPSLRTLPGLNIMNSVFSLILMQATYTVTNTFEKTTLQCVVGGMLLHYFWLCMCCCLFIYCFSMWRSFSGPITRKISQNNTRTFTHFVLFSYITPLLVVGGNATVLYLLYGDVGYGRKVCFVDNKMSNIVTFVSPLSLTCLVNTVLFVHTISKIRPNKTIRKSKQDTSELIIFGKLFSLTGCVWILQVIDGFIPQISTYSFVTTILTSTQGLFIFLSFMTSPQIIKHIKSRRNIDGKIKNNSSNTEWRSTSKDTI